MDTISATDRSRLMAKVRQRHTGPELTVRRILHGMGYRFSLHKKDLPGTPDIFCESTARSSKFLDAFGMGTIAGKGGYQNQERLSGAKKSTRIESGMRWL